MKKNFLSDEFRLILYCSRLVINEFIKQKIKELLLKNRIDWDKVISTADQQQILPFLYYNLNLLNFKNFIPKNIFLVMQNCFYSNLVRNSTIEKEILLFLTLINREKIDVIPFRGFDLEHNLYNNLGLRIMADIDILIKEKDLDKIKAVLDKLNYNYNGILDFELGFSKSLPPNIPICIEIHPNLAPARPYKINLAPIWQRAQEKNIDSQKILYLSNEDTFLALTLHLRRHTRRLTIKFIVDLAEFINANYAKLDWDYITKFAKTNRVMSVVYFSLYATKEILDTVIPNSILNKFKLNIIKRAIMHALINKRNFFKPMKRRGIALRILFFDLPQDLLFYLWKMAIKTSATKDKAKK